MELFLIVVLIAVVGCIFYFVRKKNKVVVDLPENPYKGKRFMSKDKIEFHKRLLRLLPQDEYYVFPEVSMNSLMTPSVSIEHVAYYQIRDTFSTKTVDFVITNKEYKVFFVIELQESQGENNKDMRVFEYLKKAGYKVIVWNANNQPSNKEIQLKITGKYDEELDNNGLM